MSSTNPIIDLKVRAVRLPMPVPHRTASGVISESPLVPLDLHTKEGIVGRSYVFTYTPAALNAYGGVGYEGARGSDGTAEQWAKAGIRGVKAKIGYPTVREDLEVIRAIRSAVGDDVEIMVDYKQCLNAVEARSRSRMLDDEGLVWIEEPTTAHDFAGLAACARETRTPVQAGENWWGPNDFATAIETGASDHLMPDVTGWMRVASMAQAKGLPVSNHLFTDYSAHSCRRPRPHGASNTPTGGTR